MTRQEIEQLFASNVDSMRNRVCEIASKLGRELDPARLGWIGAASKRQLLMEIMWLLANNQPEQNDLPN